MNRTSGSTASMPVPGRLRVGVAPWMLALCLTSCGPAHPDRVALFPGRGRVLYQGQPAAGVELRFHADPPRPDGLTPLARTRGDGTFALTTYEGEDGAPPGRYVVGLRWPEQDLQARGPKPDRLREKFHDPAKSSWRVEVVPGENVLQDIEIPASATQDEPPKKPAPGRSKAKNSHDGPRARPGATGSRP